MRSRSLLVIALLALPSIVPAQVRPRPPVRRGSPPQAIPLPPEAVPVARALAYKRSRWSAEGYSMISTMDFPAASGGSIRSTAVGAGTRADFRYSNYFSATVDLTGSLLGQSGLSATGELGTRFSPLGWDDHPLRPFLDVRAAYLHMYDTFFSTTANSGLSGANPQYIEQGRYNRGFGSVGGAGMEYSLTNSVAITTELSALRARMTTYRVNGPGTVPTGTGYWMTSLRYTLGIKFNPVRTLHLKQTPGL